MTEAGQNHDIIRAEAGQKQKQSRTITELDQHLNQDLKKTLADTKRTRSSNRSRKHNHNQLGSRSEAEHDLGRSRSRTESEKNLENRTRT